MISSSELLPIGSIVLMKNEFKRRIIVGVYSRNTKGEMCDYVTIGYPEGLRGQTQFGYFNNEDIKQIFFEANIDEEWDEVKVELEKEAVETMHQAIQPISQPMNNQILPSNPESQYMPENNSYNIPLQTPSFKKPLDLMKKIKRIWWISLGLALILFVFWLTR